MIDLPNLPIIIMNGDVLTKVDFKELLSFHVEHGADATMCVREYDFQVPYGVVKSKDHRIESIVEKPIHKFFINAGIYVLNADILNFVNGEDYLDMPKFFSMMINKEKEVNMFPLHEYWLDIGRMEQFERAQQDVREVFK